MSCPDCFKGSAHEGSPTGRTEELHGRETYISEPPAGVAPKAIVLILSDGLGWEFVNIRILADKFASEGPFIVYLPDFLGGHASPTWVMEPMNRLTTEGGVIGWLWKPWYLAKVIAGIAPMLKFNIFNDPWPDVKSYFAAIRNGNDRKDLPIAVAG
ncbi:Fc.00g026400.m01.CDS01 [Cosmosporella sp. VM-42]